jgi:hypothetical protein
MGSMGIPMAIIYAHARRTGAGGPLMLEIERGEVIDRLVAICGFCGFCGFPAPGKSTLARKLEHWRIPVSGLLPGPL